MFETRFKAKLVVGCIGLLTTAFYFTVFKGTNADLFETYTWALAIMLGAFSGADAINTSSYFSSKGKGRAAKQDPKYEL